MSLSVLSLSLLGALQEPAPATAAELIAQYRADQGALDRLYSFPLSERGLERRSAQLETWRELLDAQPFEDWSADARLDWLLLNNQLRRDREAIRERALREADVRPLVPFAAPLVGLLDDRAARVLPDPKATAAVLHAASEAVVAARTALEEGGTEVPPTTAARAADLLGALRQSLGDWYRDHAGYEPLFSWWCEAPWEALDRDLEAYASFLRRDVGGWDPNDPDQLIGDPIGRQALLDSLAYERIAYSPEELIAIAERELAWCMTERQRAATEMGLGEDWRAAQAVVKEVHAEPGGQAAMIRMLADEAVTFLEERNLLTLPELAKEVWRMDMMSLQRQKFTPYFTGGEVISIAYPTERMDHADKLMSMRGNNLHYSRATVQHELIPGHHLQGYMAQRWNPHRRTFSTPFYSEGWALYWELRLWDLGFTQSPEDRIGMLFWRSHRCARIIFSLRFHLGDWTPQECIDFLVENVGHERRNATAEVRRSIQGGYSPLYQAAYMTGGLQLRELHRELVVEGDWSERAFHDAVLKAGPIPIEFLRARMRGDELRRDMPVAWRFAEGD
jgi:hypothetical protein